MANTTVVKSKKGKIKVRYNPGEYPEAVNDFVSTVKAACEQHGGVFQHAWMDEVHIQLDYIFDHSEATLQRHFPGAKGSWREAKLTHLTINHPKDKSYISAIHLQGIAAKSDPTFKPLKDAVDQLRAQINVTAPKHRAVKISAIKQPEYIHRDQVKWLLIGAGATDVTFVTTDQDITYGVKVEGKYNGVAFRVLVYHQFSGSLNQNCSKRSVVWEMQGESDPRIEWLRKTVDVGIESNKRLQQAAARYANGKDLAAEKLTAKFSDFVIVEEPSATEFGTFGY